VCVFLNSEKKAGGHLEFFPGKEAETQDKNSAKKCDKKNKVRPGMNRT